MECNFLKGILEKEAKKVKKSACGGLEDNKRKKCIGF